MVIGVVWLDRILSGQTLKFNSFDILQIKKENC